MYNAKIIVTVNPANWEGDFRLWEAMATGALIFVDYLFVPHSFPLVDGEHVVFYHNNNKTELWEKLNYYRNNPTKAKEIAYNGYLYAMKYHRTVSMMDYILRTAHTKLAADRREVLPRYPFTGQYLVRQTMRQMEKIRSTGTPARYYDGYPL